MSSLANVGAKRRRVSPIALFKKFTGRSGKYGNLASSTRKLNLTRLVKDYTQVEFKYSEQRIIGTVANYDEYTYRANGMYDPRTAIGGHQPLGFDQYMGLYARFEVVTSKIDVTMWSSSPTTGGIQLGIVKSIDATPISKEQLRELPNTRAKHIIGPCGYFANNAQGQAITLSSTMNVAKFLGTAVNDPDIQGTDLTDPSRIAYWYIRVDDIGTAALTQYFQYVVITYVARLTGMQTIGQS